jgi:hypothetical protein
MSKKVNLALLTLAAFSLVGSSIAAAGPKPDKVHTLTSVPVWGDGVTCVVANTTEVPIVVNMDVYRADGAMVVDDYTWILDPHASNGNGGETGTLSYCVISWQGQKSDLTASICSLWSDQQPACVAMTQ